MIAHNYLQDEVVLKGYQGFTSYSGPVQLFEKSCNSCLKRDNCEILSDLLNAPNPFAFWHEAFTARGNDVICSERVREKR